MKTIPKFMDLSEPPMPICGEACPSHLGKLMQDAFKATCRSDVESSQYALLRIQGQCCKHIHTLTVQEDIHRDNKDDDSTEFVEQDYNDLITFIAGVGTACGEVVTRLDGYTAVELDEMIGVIAMNNKP